MTRLKEICVFLRILSFYEMIVVFMTFLSFSEFVDFLYSMFLSVLSLIVINFSYCRNNIYRLLRSISRRFEIFFKIIVVFSNCCRLHYMHQVFNYLPTFINSNDSYKYSTIKRQTFVFLTC